MANECEPRALWMDTAPHRLLLQESKSHVNVFPKVDTGVQQRDLGSHSSNPSLGRYHVSSASGSSCVQREGGCAC